MCSLSVSLYECRKKNHTFMIKQLPAGRTCLTKISYADPPECVEREFIYLLLEAIGFVYNDDNDDLSSTHVKDIAHHSPVKLVLSHQESDVFVISNFHMIGERTTISL